MDVFVALADPVRRDILRRLAPAPLRVVDIARAYDISRPAVSRHLRVLTEAGVVQLLPQGREHHYRVAPEALAPVAALLTELTGVPQPARVREEHLMALDVEVRRTAREHRTAPGHRTTTPTEETA